MRSERWEEGRDERRGEIGRDESAGSGVRRMWRVVGSERIRRWEWGTAKPRARKWHVATSNAERVTRDRPTNGRVHPAWARGGMTDVRIPCLAWVAANETMRGGPRRRWVSSAGAWRIGIVGCGPVGDRSA